MKAFLLAVLVSVLLPSCLMRAEEVMDFENDGTGAEPKNLILTLTGPGTTDNSVWEIQENASAPSGKKVLAITKADALADCYQAALWRGKKFQNFEVSVRFKILGGTVAQAAGLMFRAVDVDHSYLVYASALENSVVMYKINKKEQTKVTSGKASIALDRWHTLKIVGKGPQLECFLNGGRIMSASNATYLNGKVGAISRGDSIVLFDDLTVGIPAQ